MTPLIRVRGLAAASGVTADIVGKCEFFNPLDSVKDRIGIAMIEAAESQGLIAPGHTTLIEPTSGNTGIALAFAAAAKGYRLVLVMPGGNSLERRKMLRLLGATIVLTPAHRGIRGAIRHAGELVRVTPGAYMLQQFRNPANPEAHRRGTAEEIWRDTGGRIDVLVAGVGTGGTLTGVADVLKARKASLHVVAVEPDGSPVLSGGTPGPHKIQGLGPGFVPETLDTRLIDEVVRVPSHRAFETARHVARLDALPVGISSGAALAAALEIGKREAFAGKLIVAILPSCAERYLSTELFDGLE
ncbi:cysteine synthase [Azospirillum sp. TSO22-1]|nr:cysteine synthase [Azospirillum sp. TSO22-1]